MFLHIYILNWNKEVGNKIVHDIHRTMIAVGHVKTTFFYVDSVSDGTMKRQPYLYLEN